MSRRVVLAPDVLVAAVGGASEVDGAAARRALRGWVEHSTDLLVAAPVWPALLDALRSRGWPAARVVEALHALDELGLVTVEADRPAILLAVDAMERNGVVAPLAAALVLAEIEDAPLASLDPRTVAAAEHGIQVTEGAGAAPGPVGSGTRRPSGRPTLPDYQGLGALLGDLRRAAEARR